MKRPRQETREPEENVDTRKKGAAAAKKPSPRNPKQQQKLQDEVKLVLQRVLERLSIGATLPHGSVLGRESHVDRIVDFMKGDACRTLLLFGMPGTGKTCAVKHALLRMGESSAVALFLNGYMVQRPTDVYRTLCLHLTRHRLGHEEATLGPEQAASYLERRFRTLGWGKSKNATRTCVIVIDEMDKCIEKNPKVLYRLVEWLSLPHAHCKLIGIANSMEFPMDQKTRSRLDTTSQIVFQPYTERELQFILQQRLDGVESRFPIIINQRARDYLCHHTAVQYGDVRRLLQSTASAVHGLLCSLEEGEATVVEEDAQTKGLVEFRHVHAVVGRVFQERFRDFVMSLTSGALFLVICVVTVETRRIESQRGSAAGGSGSPSLSLQHLWRQCQQVLSGYHKQLGIEDPQFFNHTTFLSMLSSLKEVAFLELAFEENSVVGRVPLTSVREVLLTSEPVVVTMTQLPEMTQTMCEVHDIFGVGMQPYLRT